MRFHAHRFEFKYLIDKRFKDDLLNDFLNYMDFDIPNGSGREYYQVLNLYLDSPDLRFYREKIDGLLFRRKLRFRFYNVHPKENSCVFMEIKRKNNMTFIKDRLKLGYQDALNIVKRNFNNIFPLLEQYELQQRELLSEFVFEVLRNRLSSKLWVSYQRTALKGKSIPRLRLTFDDNIIAARAGNGFDFRTDSSTRRLFRNKTVVEVKYNGTLPYWLHHFIQKYQLFREPISKYCCAVENILI